MICTIIGDFFDSKFLFELSDLVESLSFCPNNIANRKTWPYGSLGSHKLFGCKIFERSGLNRIDFLHEKSSTFFDIFEAIEDSLNQKFYLSRIDINLQHSFCDGTTHLDKNYGSHTIMLMSNSHWEKEWGGKFQIISENDESVVEEHDYIPGRIILFPSSFLHRGLSPNKKYIYRHTIVFRVKLISFEE